MLNKRKERKNSLTISTEVVCRSDKQNSPFILPLLCLISVVFMYFLIKIADGSFNIFTSVGIGKFDSEISGNALRNFWFTALAGCGVISFVVGIKKHSVKITFGLLGILCLFFGYNYVLVANGFTRALNKVICTVFYSQNPSSGTYYLIPFQSVDSSRELKYFCLAVTWGTCFLVACAVVRYCNPIILATCLALYSAPALAYFTFTGETYFIAAVMCCLLVFAVRVSGYRSFEISSPKHRFSRTFKIYGRDSSRIAIQQLIAGILTMSVTALIVTSVYDTSDYKRDDDVDKLGNNILQSVQNLGISGFGVGTSNVLNNGQVYNSGNLKYTGETMFKLKSTNNFSASPLYFRAYTAGDYDGKRWSELTKKIYRTNDDMWNLYKGENFFPQFMYSYVYDIISPNSRRMDVEIANENINSRTFLTSPNLSVSESEELTKAVTNYDNGFRVDSISGLDSYNQTIIYNDSSNYNLYIDTETIGNTISDTLYSGKFSTSLDVDALASSESNEVYSSISEFYDREEQYRKFVVENYTSYPEIIDDIFSSEINLEECYNSAKTDFTYDHSIDGIDIYLDEYSYNYDSSSIVEVPNNYIIYDYYTSVISQIKEYIHSKAEYTLSPGGTPYGKDFVDYFLNENHKGYCVHFATAATLMLRKAGIPARYAEGYYVSSSDQLNTDDYGYVSVPDSRAHAWTEVYIPLFGWTVVDFTPSYDSNGEVPKENDDWTEESDTDTVTDTDSPIDNESDKDSDKSNSDSEILTDRNTADEEKAVGLTRQTKGLLWIIGIIAGTVAIWIFARFAVIYIRKRKFTSSNTRSAALAMYLYSLRLLKTKGIVPLQGEGEQEFAVRVSNELDFDDEKLYCKFTYTALSARFDKVEPSKEKIVEMNEYINAMSNYVITSSTKFKKFIMKYLLFLQ